VPRPQSKPGIVPMLCRPVRSMHPDITMISPTDSSAGSLNLFAAPLQGIQRGLAQADEAARKIAAGDVSPQNVVDQMEASILVKANVASMRTADEVLGALLDEKA